jgi:hypothetical protein
VIIGANSPKARYGHDAYATALTIVGVTSLPTAAALALSMLVSVIVRTVWRFFG